jgi:hypothetical protein
MEWFSQTEAVIDVCSYRNVAAARLVTLEADQWERSE